MTKQELDAIREKYKRYSLSLITPSYVNKDIKDLLAEIDLLTSDLAYAKNTISAYKILGERGAKDE